MPTYQEHSLWKYTPREVKYRNQQHSVRPKCPGYVYRAIFLFTTWQSVFQLAEVADDLSDGVMAAPGLWRIDYPTCCGHGLLYNW